MNNNNNNNNTIIITESFRMGTRGNAKKRRPKERWIDGVRRSMTNHGLVQNCLPGCTAV
jgi:hypothetical protein